LSAVILCIKTNHKQWHLLQGHQHHQHLKVLMVLLLAFDTPPDFLHIKEEVLPAVLLPAFVARRELPYEKEYLPVLLIPAFDDAHPKLL
jgi:hypothetical protein